MTERAYDPALTEIVPLLPTVSDFSTAEKVDELRGNTEALIPNTDPPPEITREDRTIASTNGGPEFRIRIYRRNDSDRSPSPAFLEIHGGGFMTGSIEMMDSFCDRVALDLDVVVVSPDYRLAPENPYPAGLDDCMATLQWMHDNADELGIDRDKVAIGGQSAGGGLSAALALRARDEGGPAVCFQLLEIPELDHRLDTPSMLAFDDTPMWNRPNAVWSWHHYLNDEAAAGNPDADVHPHASPSRATDLAGLPPAFVSVMEFDPLRDEGIDYAARLLAAGVSAELHAYPGTFHGSALVPHAPTSQQASADTRRALDRALNS